MIVISYLSLTSSYDFSGYTFFPNEDKLAHILMYAIFSFLLGRRIIGVRPFNWLLVILITSSYGILMEILQELLIAGRQFEFLDILANIFGSLSGTMLIYMLYKRKSKV